MKSILAMQYLRRVGSGVLLLFITPSSTAPTRFPVIAFEARRSSLTRVFRHDRTNPTDSRSR